MSDWKNEAITPISEKVKKQPEVIRVVSLATDETFVAIYKGSKQVYQGYKPSPSDILAATGLVFEAWEVAEDELTADGDFPENFDVLVEDEEADEGGEGDALVEFRPSFDLSDAPVTEDGEPLI